MSSASLASIISVVPSEAHWSYKRHLIVGIDNSANSTHALSWALQHMYRRGDKLHLVHVVPEPPTLHPWPGLYVPPDDALERQEFKEAADMLLAAFTPLVARAGAPCDAHLIVAAEDPSSIVSILLDKQADLEAAVLVVAPHSSGGLAEWWLGSVTKGLLAHSPVPVVVVPLGKS